jgi:hypothetical protein
MDVELQILKHLRLDARPIVSIIDLINRSCEPDQDLFAAVRSYKCFRYLPFN